MSDVQVIDLGADAKLYYNAGTYGEPTWVEIPDVKDVTLTLEKGEADGSTRRSGKWREQRGTFKDAAIETQFLRKRGINDAHFQMLRDSWLHDTPHEFLALDGPLETPGSEGLRATMEVFNFSRGEPLEDVMAHDLNIKPVPAAHRPAWFVVA